MTGFRSLTLLLIFTMPILGACARVSLAAAELPGASADVQAFPLAGAQVYSSTGRWLGEVAGVLQDTKTGELDYLVLSYREPRVYGKAAMVTNPQRFVPIPWTRFTADAGEASLNLDADEMILIPAPYLEKAPDSLSPAQASTIEAYWQSVDDERK